MKYDYAFYSDIGGRHCNEDNIFAGELNGKFIIIVADGLGGEGKGELASSQCVESIKANVENVSIFNTETALNNANNAIFDLQKKSASAMKTTVAVFYLSDDIALTDHIGDTRIYLFLNGKIIYQSKDHSVTQAALDAGEIRENEIRTHSDRNKLTQALGGNAILNGEPKTFFISEFDSVLVCTDGLWEYITEAEMSSTRVSSETAEQWLQQMKDIHKSRCKAKCDNNSAAVLLLPTLY